MRLILILSAFLVFFRLSAQPPAGYYDSAQGLNGEALRIVLHDIITNGHSTLSYDDLLSYYPTTDSKPNNKVWDMYSDVPGGTAPYEFDFSDNCGSYNSEGDCYNREHSLPASWFNDNYPMYADLFHVIPTDGYVNNRRSNYAFGEVNSPSWTAQNGSKLGPNVFSGYSGTVFEPVDSFKGDFARIYFYIATRYKDEISSWSCDMFSGNNLTAYGKNLMYSWHQMDPVSSKEIARNNAVYNIQHNRNPYVDNPQWVVDIWGPTSANDCSFGVVVITYPQPVPENVFISGINESVKYKIQIHDVSGRLISETESLLIKSGIDVSYLKPGIYFLKLSAADKIYSSKFIKQ